MPYELTFRKQLRVTDREKYWNECCIGGDLVCDALLPTIRTHYEGIESNQEDWGWFIWFSEARVELAVDVFCDDPIAGDFKVHLTSRVRRFLLAARVCDTPELNVLLNRVLNALAEWVGSKPSVLKLDAKYMPVQNA